MKCIRNQIKSKIRQVVENNEVFMNNKVNINHLKNVTLGVMRPVIEKKWQKYEAIKDLVVPVEPAMEREKKITKCVAKNIHERMILKALMRNPNLSPAQRWSINAQLRTMAKSGSHVRMRNRCSVSGHPRAYNRTMGISRHVFRKFVGMGLLPGITKGEW